MSDTKLDVTKPVQTRDGRKARIICTDRKCLEYPIIALVTNNNGGENVDSYSILGKWAKCAPCPSDSDLINVEPRVEEYRNLYDVDRQKSASAWHSSRDVALGYAAYVADNGFQPICTLKRTREGSRVISVEVVDFAKEVQE